MFDFSALLPKQLIENSANALHLKHSSHIPFYPHYELAGLCDYAIIHKIIGQLNKLHLMTANYPEYKVIGKRCDILSKYLMYNRLVPDNIDPHGYLKEHCANDNSIHLFKKELSSLLGYLLYNFYNFPILLQPKLLSIINSLAKIDIPTTGLSYPLVEGNEVLNITQNSAFL